VVEATLSPGGGGIIAMALAARGDFLVTSATGAVAPVGVGLGLPAADLAAVLSFFWEEDLVALFTDEGAVFAGGDFLAAAEVLDAANDTLLERSAVGVLTTAFLAGTAFLGAGFLGVTTLLAAGFFTVTVFLAAAFFAGDAFLEASGFFTVTVFLAGVFFTGSGFLAEVFFGLGLAATGFFGATFLAGAGFLTAALALAGTGFLAGALCLAFTLELALCLVCFTVLLLSARSGHLTPDI